MLHSTEIIFYVVQPTWPRVVYISINCIDDLTGRTRAYRRRLRHAAENIIKRDLQHCIAMLVLVYNTNIYIYIYMFTIGANANTPTHYIYICDASMRSHLEFAYVSRSDARATLRTRAPGCRRGDRAGRIAIRMPHRCNGVCRMHVFDNTFN